MKKFVFSIIAVTASFTTILTACSEKEDYGDVVVKISDKVTFNATSVDTAIVLPTRAAAPSFKDRIKLTSADGDTLVMTVTEQPYFTARHDSTVTEEKATRGVQMTAGNIASFGVSASAYPSSQSYTEHGLGEYFYDIEASPGVSTEYQWPAASQKMSFFAYYPYGNSSFALTSLATDTGSPVYSYTVPSDIAEQVDVMTAQVTDMNGGRQAACNLSFNHHCAAIRVLFSNEREETVNVRKVSLLGVKYAGTLTDGTWILANSVNGTDTHPFTLDMDEDKGQTEGGEQNDLTGTAEIFLMLPQTLPEGAKLIIETESSRYEAGITGTWLAGNTYTYSVTLTDNFSYIFNVTEPEAYTHEGGTQPFSVQSYKVSEDGNETRNVGWQVTFSTDNGETFTSEKPSWLTTSADSGDGSVAFTAFDATVTPTVMTTETTTITTLLRDMEDVQDYDLSTNGGTTLMTTANCYMIHAPGTYRFPLVYGNSIKDGAVNTQAYNGQLDETTSYTFKNHNDDNITNPWLKNNGATPDNAELIWQDVDGLISSVDIDGDYMTFSIDRDNIDGGNAVIAAKMGETVVWSWHIWVTPESYTETLITGNYQTAPVNLGWIELEEITVTDYPSRKCIVKVKQNGVKGNEYTFSIRQKKENITNIKYSKQGYCTYYQWGRKDAAPGDRYYNNNSPVYNIEGNEVTMQQVQNLVTEGVMIQSPLTVFGDSLHGSYNANAVFWNANKNSVYTAKTVYDPCPPGFCVPPYEWGKYVTLNGEVTKGTMRSWGASASDPSHVYLYEGYTTMDFDYGLWFSTIGRRNIMGIRDEAIINDDMRRLKPQGYYWTSFLYGIFCPEYPIVLPWCLLVDMYDNNFVYGLLEAPNGCTIKPVREN